MTLPSRKKLPTTVQSIRSRVKALKRHVRRGLLAGALLATSSAPLSAQSPGWQPSRLPAAPSIQPLANSRPQTAANIAQTTAQNVGSHGGSSAASAAATASGVQLRWRASSRALGAAPSAPAHHSSASAVLEQASSQAAADGQQSDRISAREQSRHFANEAWLANPLRDSGAAQSATRQNHVSAADNAQPSAADANSAGFSTARRLSSAAVSQATANRQVGHGGEVRMAAYQPPAGTQSQANPAQARQQQANAEFAQPQFQPQTLPPLQSQPVPSDPLTQPELAPMPPADASAPALDLPSALPDAASNAPFNAPMPEASPPATGGQVNPLDGFLPEIPNGQSPSDRDADRRGANDEEEFDQLGRTRSRPDSLINCETFRENLRNATLDKVNLNSAPRYGQGLSVDAELAEKKRLEFASTSEMRDWCDREGHTLVRGRMVDLRNEQVVLDINGSRRAIPLRDLCDVDMVYIGRAWNLPISCGTGYETIAGRDFVPSAMQWKASGLCHKPLYFEEVQLERYGHEIGPLLQPVVSTVHFFGNIAVLPYKMGIHPPHECQYALGYYRPGDCAPYMLPPIPISLRGAAVQAGAVVGASALIP